MAVTSCSKYIVIPELRKEGGYRYLVVERRTGKTLYSYGCDRWASRKAEELNSKKEDE